MENAERFFGACRFCKQISAGTVDGADTQKEADEIATEECHCYEAKEYQKIKKQKNLAKSFVNQLFGNETDIWKETAEDILIEFLHKAVDFVADEKIDSISVVIPNVGSAKISMNSKAE